MPNRLLRDGICTSDAINSLSDEEEVLFYRLLVVADDYGFMDGRIAIIKSQCFPLRDTATPPKIELWLAGLAGKGLIARYQAVDGKPYLAVNKWEQRVRSRPKYVGPECDGCTPIAGTLSAKCQTDDGLGKGKGKGKGATSRTSRELLTLPENWEPSPETVARLAEQFKFSNGDAERYAIAFRDACAAKGYRYADFNAAFSNCVRQDWPKFRAGAAIMPAHSGEKRVAL